MSTVAEEVKAAVAEASVLERGHFIFANGDHSLVKLEMDKLWQHPDSLRTVLRFLAEARDLPLCDVILGVPTGGQRLADAVGLMLQIPVVQMHRAVGGTKQDFCFATAADRDLAARAKSPRIYEDVVTTLSSVAGVVKLLSPQEQDIHSLAIWRRGSVLPQYRMGVTDHYLVEEELEQFAPSECPYPSCSF